MESTLWHVLMGCASVAFALCSPSVFVSLSELSSRHTLPSGSIRCVVPRPNLPGKRFAVFLFLDSAALTDLYHRRVWWSNRSVQSPVLAPYSKELCIFFLDLSHFSAIPILIQYLLLLLLLILIIIIILLLLLLTCSFLSSFLLDGSSLTTRTTRAFAACVASAELF